MKKIAVILCLLAMMFLLGCGNSSVKISVAKESAERKSCFINQESFLASADMFAAETGDYPTSNYIPAGYVGSYGKSGWDWPSEYNEFELDANNAPLCPGGGTVRVNYIDVKTRPYIECSLHGPAPDY